MNSPATFLCILLLAAVIVSVAGDSKHSKGNSDFPAFPWAGNGIPGFSGGANNVWGGFDWNKFKMPTSTVCKLKGRCFNKKLVCPARCFKSVKKSGKNGGSSASSGSCNLDCVKCVATC